MTRPITPAKLHATLKRLSLEQKQELLIWLSAVIADEQASLLQESVAKPVSSESRHYEGKTYQQEKRRCYRAGCKCMSGELSEVGHGPYWYAYWKDGGKMHNRYIGKRAPWEAKAKQDSRTEPKS
ncbi:DUF6788 family protein [Leptolyngbya sp. AN02str]|uniref:DUF6788 family protein n=1 Tax=Leptolyngbya sp. AN02str TaxID=3423363 RepID=UPI003D317FA9